MNKVTKWEHERVILKDRIAALEADNAALRAQLAARWAPVGEGLPPNDDKQLLLTILVELEGKEPYYHATKAFFIRSRWGVNDPDTGYIEPLEKVAYNRRAKVTPIAWQPWPAPYRPEDE